MYAMSKSRYYITKVVRALFSKNLWIGIIEVLAVFIVLAELYLLAVISIGEGESLNQKVKEDRAYQEADKVSNQSFHSFHEKIIGFYGEK